MDTVLLNVKGLSEVVIIDCLTMLTSNLFDELKDFQKVFQRIEALLEVINDSELTVIMVTNEVGSGIVPDNALARRYADALGILNQRVAAVATQVVLVAAGQPLMLKPNRQPEFAL